jgi:hypothetical protein
VAEESLQEQRHTVEPAGFGAASPSSSRYFVLYLAEDEAVKVVYVDKALPPRSMTTVEKNLWFHKFAVKSLMCGRRRQKCFP